jgi:hypothetical protein
MEEDFPLVPPPVAPLDDALLRPVDIASTAIARALWPSFYEEAGNPVGSPAAVVAALALVAAMARADVAARIHAFLQLDGDRALNDHRMAVLLRGWHGDFAAPGFVVLQRPFVARGARLDDDVKSRLRGPYASPAAFVVADGNEGVRTRIHRFFAARTRGAVEHLVAFEGIVPEVPVHVVTVARACLVVRGVRAVGRFRVGGVMPLDVEAVRVREGVSVARGPEALVLRVPLTDPRWQLDLLVPDEGRRLADVESLALPLLLDHRRAMTPVRGAVLFPALDTVPGEALRLRDPLWGAGLSEPFDPERSPLAMQGLPRTWVSELFHFTRASWSAADVADGPSGPAAVAVDRPFTWALRDARWGALLALGRVFDPRE